MNVVGRQNDVEHEAGVSLSNCYCRRMGSGGGLEAGETTWLPVELDSGRFGCGGGGRRRDRTRHHDDAEHERSSILWVSLSNGHCRRIVAASAAAGSEAGEAW